MLQASLYYRHDFTGKIARGYEWVAKFEDMDTTMSFSEFAELLTPELQYTEI